MKYAAKTDCSTGPPDQADANESYDCERDCEAKKAKLHFDRTTTAPGFFQLELA